MQKKVLGLFYEVHIVSAWEFNFKYFSHPPPPPKKNIKYTINFTVFLKGFITPFFETNLFILPSVFSICDPIFGHDP